MTIHPTDLVLPEGVRAKRKGNRVYWELRHGTPRRDVSLKGIEGELTAELLIQIQQAVEAIRGGVKQPEHTKGPKGRERALSTLAGTWGLAWRVYQDDPQDKYGWHQLSKGKTQRYYRAMAERWLDSPVFVGDTTTWKEITVAGTSQRAIYAFLDVVKTQGFNAKGKGAQSQARKLQQLIRRLAQVAVGEGWISARENPTYDMVWVKRTTGKRKSWPAAEMAAYEARWALGTPERAAYELTKWTGARQGDIVEMRMSSVEKKPTLNAAGQLVWERFLMIKIGKGQEKRIRERGEAKLLPIKVTPMLEQNVIAFMKPGQDYLLVGHNGKPLAASGMTTFFANARERAGLSRHGYSQHGLRSFMASFAATAKATEKQVAAILGHESPNQNTRRYMEEANAFNLSSDALDLVTQLVERQAELEKALAAFNEAGGNPGGAPS